MTSRRRRRSKRRKGREEEDSLEVRRGQGSSTTWSWRDRDLQASNSHKGYQPERDGTAREEGEDQGRSSSGGARVEGAWPDQGQ